MKDIHSGKSYPFKEICSFGNIYLFQSPQPLYDNYKLYNYSWIKYSYNLYRLKDEEIVNMIEGSLLWSLSVSFLLPSCEEIPPKAVPLPTLYLRQNLICPPASRLYLKELLNILQTVSSCSRYTTFILFGSRFHRQNLPIPKRFRSDLRTTSNLSLNADVSENTLPFVS